VHLSDACRVLTLARKETQETLTYSAGGPILNDTETQECIGSFASFVQDHAVEAIDADGILLPEAGFA